VEHVWELAASSDSKHPPTLPVLAGMLPSLHCYSVGGNVSLVPDVSRRGATGCCIPSRSHHAHQGAITCVCLPCCVLLQWQAAAAESRSISLEVL
jgi:hypothetical protein